MKRLGWSLALLPLLLLLGSQADQLLGRKPETRQGRVFNVLQIVRFPNDACVATGSRNGTCYTAEECEDLSGTSSGSCASGFGVCCVFSVGCSSTSRQNCTYFEDTSATAGTCTATICRCNDNICQLRLDFNQFVISGPDTSTTAAFKVINGVPATADSARSVSTATQCNTDTFGVTNPGGCTPPIICGTNTGEHMYVDASSACNDLNFNLGSASAINRQWSIKVTQYSCDYENLAPQCCTQYFFGSDTGSVQTFNYNNGNGLHLANQDQSICFRRERGNCRICFNAINTADFQLSGTVKMANQNEQSVCCGYGKNGRKRTGYDCIQIPGAFNNNVLAKESRYCGRDKIGGGNTRCTFFNPFLIRFMSDNFEFTKNDEFEAAQQDSGFKLAYIQDSMSCDLPAIR